MHPLDRVIQEHYRGVPPELWKIIFGFVKMCPGCRKVVSIVHPFTHCYPCVREADGHDYVRLRRSIMKTRDPQHTFDFKCEPCLSRWQNVHKPEIFGKCYHCKKPWHGYVEGDSHVFHTCSKIQSQCGACQALRVYTDSCVDILCTMT